MIIRIKSALFLFSLCVLLTPALAAVGEPPGSDFAPIPVAAVSGPVTEVPAWDETSPQKLVVIDGKLYQRDGGHYYRVVQDRITVRLAEGVESWQDLLNRALESAPQTFAGLRALETVRENSLRIIDLRTPEGADLPALADLIHRTGLVRYAELTTWGAWTLTPDDPRFDEQWALENTGQTGGTPGADIKAVSAWDLVTGDPEVPVAVIDSGTDIDHPDLVPTVWHNEDEIPDNGIDDDGNGYVDDWEGWDFNNNNNDPRSTYFHGTHVTGIVCAATNNGVGIAGVAGGDNGGGVRGMALGVGDSAPNGNVLDDAILYAADNGARVITLSLSVGETQAINDALDYAYNTADVFIDCAAGNSGSSVSYPARRPEVMSVASTTHNDEKSSFSNPGPENEVAAPGSDILSTQLDNTYGTSSGTSFAAPHVAGVAGLIRSRNPGLPAPEVRQILIDSSVDVGPAGFDNGTGWGRIDAFEAVSLAANSNGIVRLNRDAYSCQDEMTITVSDIDLAGQGTVDVTLTSDTEPAGEVITLDETGGDSGVFRNTVPTTSGDPATDGVLQLSHDDLITVEYIDADDGEGGTNVSKTDTAVADCRAPAVSDVEAENIDDVSADITWTTDEASTSVVRYGAVAPPTEEASRPGLVTDHNVPLDSLTECTIYKYEVESTDALGNAVIDDNAGQYYTFETYGNFPGVGVIPCHRGQAQLDDDSYTCETVVSVSVTDIDLNTDTGQVETVDVLMTSTTEPGGEWITLTELDADNSRFEGTINLTAGPATPDGLLQIAAGDLITVTYYDDDDGEGRPRTSTDSAHIDCVAPRIGEVRVTNLLNSRAIIEWDTDEPSTSRVDYGPTPALGQTVSDDALVTSHELTISGFEACERIYFRVSSVDEHGDERVADAGGAPFAFNLNQIGGLVFYDGFEGDTGWQTDGEWERGLPEGRGSYAGDPSSAFSGQNVLGVDLTGQGTYPGDYEPNVEIGATSPTFDASQASNLELIYRRKLGTRSGDEVSVNVLTAGVSQVWRSTGTINDSGWIEARHDISEEADGRPSVSIIFRQLSDGSSQSFGWNIDEFIVKDAARPDYEACSTCEGAPSFAGLVSVSDPAPCAAGGLELGWDPATSWGSGGAGTYEVHRGSTPDFTPSEANRVVSGLTTTTWTDANAPVDEVSYYVVRARNNESCGAGGGLSDDNLVRLAATETIDQPAPSSPGNTLEVEALAAAHARLTWSATAGAAYYTVRRSESPDFSGAEDLANPSQPLYEDENALENAKIYFYRVVAVNSCGEETP